MKRIVAFLGLAAVAVAAHASNLGCVDTNFRVFGDDKVCVAAFKDPEVEGVTCYVSYAKTGGLEGAVGLAENKSRFALSCRQTGPIILPNGLPRERNGIFKVKASAFFKSVDVSRMYDAENGTLVYLAISTKLINGSPFNSLSAVPLAAWGGTPARIGK